MPNALETRKTSSVNWSEFLGRRPFAISHTDCNRLVSGQIILITGAGGSIGSNLALLLMNSSAARLILLDHAAESLHALQNIYQQQDLVLPEIKFVEADILDWQSLNKIFEEHKPNIVFHAAALKHLVPLETDPFSAFTTNTFGAEHVAKIARAYGVGRFIHVSTDKAVNPTSILGVSKRIAEVLLRSRSEPGFITQSLRMGNVLGSSGSVVPAFVQALECGRPLPITDPNASRYFITVEEAAGFLVQSLALEDAALLVPEMGHPRKVGDLAKFLMDSYDLSEQNVIHTELRNGEKLCEQLTFDFEELHPTQFPHLYEICGDDSSADRSADAFNRLKTVVKHRISGELMDALIKLVPSFRPSPTLMRSV